MKGEKASTSENGKACLSCGEETRENGKGFYSHEVGRAIAGASENGKATECCQSRGMGRERAGASENGNTRSSPLS